MICTIAQKLFGTLKIEHKNAAGEVTKTINLEGDTTKPFGQRWRRVSIADLVEKETRWKFDKTSLFDAPAEVFENVLLEFAKKQTARNENDDQIPLTEAAIKFGMGFAMRRLKELSPAEQLQEVYEKLIEPTLIDPTFVTHIPSVIIPLAKKNADDPFFADVYELAINGQEISPGYTELNDPEVQAKNFAQQVGNHEEQQKVDEDFLTALQYGMPPAGGIGLGIDRLVMMLTGAESIRDVILFPLMKPTL
jgi:lysyl-tRNA synthetase class 2